MTFSYLLLEAMSLGNRYWKFRDNQVVSHSNVDNIKNNLSHKDVGENLLRNVDNKLPVDTASHINSKETACS
jgi:hypothetical protein